MGMFLLGVLTGVILCVIAVVITFMVAINKLTK